MGIKPGRHRAQGGGEGKEALESYKGDSDPGRYFAYPPKKDRAANGRLLPGHKVGRDWSPANAALRRLKAFEKEATPDHIGKVYHALYQMALSGDVNAIREYLTRVLGKPADLVTQEMLLRVRAVLKGGDPSLLDDGVFLAVLPENEREGAQMVLEAKRAPSVLPSPGTTEG